jgi:hypothetical protein
MDSSQSQQFARHGMNITGICHMRRAHGLWQAQQSSAVKEVELDVRSGPCSAVHDVWCMCFMLTGQ